MSFWVCFIFIFVAPIAPFFCVSACLKIMKKNLENLEIVKENWQTP